MNGGHNDEKGTLHKPKLGTPQGGILIPLVATARSNIVKDKLEKFLGEEKLRLVKG